jgi:Tol biopolymer transport system component
VAFAAEGAIRAVPFDVNQLKATGAVVSVVEGVSTHSSGGADFALARDGSLVYVTGGNPDQRTLVWVDRGGQWADTGLTARSYRIPRLSPDGQRVAVEVTEDGVSDIWVYDLERGVGDRLTRQLDATQPAWAPDSTRIAYWVRRHEEGPGAFWQAADGTRVEERLTTGRHVPLAFTPDGEFLILIDLGGEGGADIAMTAVDGSGRIEPIVTSPEFESGAAISPNGEHLAFEAEISGRPELFVQPFPSGPRTRISRDGGSQPVWTANGSELVYRVGQRLMSVRVNPEGPSSWAMPVQLFNEPFFFGPGPRHFDITADGQRFMMVRSAEDEGPSRQVVHVANWLAELERLVPTTSSW